ncbi:IS3 family transposase [Nonomuraea sp. SBT364]|uniref:IS3 family transposase n=1 Tax=Nonomuraea sp. SBT364 TaxID=1580530 RepID=UPI000AA974AD|nr:IS3 family transposase [Nonomuraea sp. SBT364]
MPSPHPAEFRRRAVELARQGDKPLLQLAKDLGVSRSCLQNWLRQADADDNAGPGDRLTSAEKKELADDRIPVAVACRVLQVSTSGYYEWLGRPEPPRELRNKELSKMIRQIHADSRGSYGSPRVHAELTLGLGEQVNRKRVEQLMRAAGLQGIYRRKGRRSLVNQATEEDLVQRRFDVEAPDRLWLTDITEHPTREESCIAPPSWTPIHDASSAGPSTHDRIQISW